MVGGNTCDILSVNLEMLTSDVLSDLRHQQCINQKDQGETPGFKLQRWECGSMSYGKF